MHDRILTTHVGSLPRPDALLSMMHDQVEGRPYDPAALEAEIAPLLAMAEFDAVQTGLANSEDAREGSLAFAEKRAPNWTGR